MSRPGWIGRSTATSMSTLLTIAERAGTHWFDVETYLCREAVGDSGGDSDAPTAAGGALRAEPEPGRWLTIVRSSVS